MEKYYNEEGEVAVLVSHGYGSGWSTWGDNSEFLSMDKGLVGLHLQGAEEGEVEKYIKDKTGKYEYMGGWYQVSIKWLPKGTAFIIEEYYGVESIRTLDKLTLVS